MEKYKFNRVLIVLLVVFIFLGMYYVFGTFSNVETHEKQQDRIMVAPDPVASQSYHMLSNTDVIDLSADISEDTPNGTAEILFYRYASTATVDCTQTKWMGKYPGGWNTCQSTAYKFKQPCLAYSVGINNDWQFDDAVSKEHGCTVHAYDPSMKKESHQRSKLISFHNAGLAGSDTTNWMGWKMYTFTSLLKQNGDENSVIDILKIDCEYCEWEAFDTMIKDGVFSRVKQLVFEWHITSGILRTPEEIKNIHHGRTISDSREFAYMYRILKKLHDIGFRMFSSHQNPTGKYKSIFTGREHSCCFEVYYININFDKSTTRTRR